MVITNTPGTGLCSQGTEAYSIFSKRHKANLKLYILGQIHALVFVSTQPTTSKSLSRNKIYRQPV